MITSEEIETFTQTMLMAEWSRVSFAFEANTGLKPDALLAPYNSPAAVDVEFLNKNGVAVVFANVDRFQAGKVA